MRLVLHCYHHLLTIPAYYTIHYFMVFRRSLALSTDVRITTRCRQNRRGGEHIRTGPSESCTQTGSSYTVHAYCLQADWPHISRLSPPCSVYDPTLRTGSIFLRKDYCISGKTSTGYFLVCLFLWPSTERVWGQEIIKKSNSTRLIIYKNLNEGK